jgi:hypothetical protein
LYIIYKSGASKDNPLTIGMIEKELSQREIYRTVRISVDPNVLAHLGLITLTPGKKGQFGDSMKITGVDEALFESFYPGIVFYGGAVSAQKKTIEDAVKELFVEDFLSKEKDGLISLDDEEGMRVLFDGITKRRVAKVLGKETSAPNRVVIAKKKIAALDRAQTLQLLGKDGGAAEAGNADSIESYRMGR